MLLRMRSAALFLSLLAFFKLLIPHTLCAEENERNTPSKPHYEPLPVYLEEFFLSEAVRSEERGELQATVDAHGFSGKGYGYDGQAADLSLEYGLTRRLQARLEVPYGITATSFSDTPSSWSAMSTGLLYQFVLSNHPFALCSALNISLPVNGKSEIGWEPELLVAKAFGRLQIHSSLEPEFSDEEHSLGYNLAAVRPLSRHWIPTLELNGRHGSGIDSIYLTPGMYLHLPHRMEMGAAVPSGINKHSNSTGFVFKMTWEVGGDKD